MSTDSVDFKEPEATTYTDTPITDAVGKDPFVGKSSYNVTMKEYEHIGLLEEKTTIAKAEEKKHVDDTGETRWKNSWKEHQVLMMAPKPGVVPNWATMRKFDKSYFIHYKMLRPQLSSKEPRLDFLPDYDPGIRLAPLTLEEKKYKLAEKLGLKDENGNVDKGKLVCAHPGCQNMPLYRCCPKKSFLRNINYQRVWQGCGKVVCEQHVVKLFNDGDLQQRSKHMLSTLFYDHERYVPPPKEKCCDMKKCCRDENGNPCCINEETGHYCCGDDPTIDCCGYEKKEGSCAKMCKEKPVPLNRAKHQPAVERYAMTDFLKKLLKYVKKERKKVNSMFYSRAYNVGAQVLMAQKGPCWFAGETAESICIVGMAHMKQMELDEKKKKQKALKKKMKGGCMCKCEFVECPLKKAAKKAGGDDDDWGDGPKEGKKVSADSKLDDDDKPDPNTFLIPAGPEDVFACFECQRLVLLMMAQNEKDLDEFQMDKCCCCKQQNFQKWPTPFKKGCFGPVNKVSDADELIDVNVDWDGRPIDFLNMTQDPMAGKQQQFANPVTMN